VTDMSSDPKSTSMPTSGGKELHCSFCGKTQNEVRRLVAGTDACICDDCVEVCNEIIAHDSRFSRGPLHAGIFSGKTLVERATGIEPV